VTLTLADESAAEAGVEDTFSGSCTTRSAVEPRVTVAVIWIVPAAAEDDTVTPTAARPDEPVFTLASESVTPLGAESETVWPDTGWRPASVTVMLNVPDVPCANVGEDERTRAGSCVTESAEYPLACDETAISDPEPAGAADEVFRVGILHTPL
jgi:hypothetical protein